MDNRNEPKLSGAQVRYMICLYRLSREAYGVKNVELSTLLGVSKPSVHHMLKSLSDLGMVVQETFGRAYLTRAGQALAYRYALGYRVLSDVLTELCGQGAASEQALCALLADMPSEELEKLIRGRE